MAWHTVATQLGSVKCLGHPALQLWRTCRPQAPDTRSLLSLECSCAAPTANPSPLCCPWSPQPPPSTWLLPPHLRCCCCMAALPRAVLSDGSEYKPQTGATWFILNFLVAALKGLKEKKSYYLQSFLNSIYHSCVPTESLKFGVYFPPEAHLPSGLCLVLPHWAAQA